MTLPDPHGQPEFYESVTAKRLLAWLVDTLIVGVLTFIAGLLTFTVALFFFFFVFALIDFIYRSVTLSSRSATLGMRFVGIELRRADGTRLDGGSALLHTLGYYLCLTVSLGQFISMILMLVTDRGQSLVDLALGTVMLNRRTATYRA